MLKRINITRIGICDWVARVGALMPLTRDCQARGTTASSYGGNVFLIESGDVRLIWWRSAGFKRRNSPSTHLL